MFNVMAAHHVSGHFKARMVPRSAGFFFGPAACSGNQNRIASWRRSRDRRARQRDKQCARGIEMAACFLFANLARGNDGGIFGGEATTM